MRRSASRLVHSERPCRLRLPSVDGIDTGADDLPHVRAFVDPERQDSGHHGPVQAGEAEVQRVRDQREAEQEVGAEVDEEDLDEQRRPPKMSTYRPESRRSGNSFDRRISAATRPSTTPIACAIHGDVHGRVPSRAGRRGPDGSVPRRCASRRRRASRDLARPSDYLRKTTASPIPHLAAIRFIAPVAYNWFTAFCTAARSGSCLRIARPYGSGLIGEPAIWRAEPG